MSPTTPNIWLDKFLFIDSIIVSLLCFIDWILGEEIRANIRDKFGDFWLYSSELSAFDLHKKSLRSSIDLLAYIHKEEKLKKFVKRCFIFANLAIFWVLVYWGRTFLFEDRNITKFLECILVSLFFSVFNTAGYIFSYKITIYLIKKMIEAKSLFREIKYIMFDLCFAGIACGISFGIPFTLISILAINIGFVDPPDNFSYYYLLGLPLFVFIIPICGVLFPENTNGSYLVGTWLIVSSSLPTIIHIFLSFTSFLSKVLLPICKPVIDRILYAFYDSKKGVLASLSIFIGTLAKLVQMYIKNYL